MDLKVREWLPCHFCDSFSFEMEKIAHTIHFGTHLSQSRTAASNR